MNTSRELRQFDGLAWGLSPETGRELAKATKEAFEEAMQICIGLFPPEEVQCWMSTKLDIHGVSEAIHHAQQQYMSKRRCKAAKWLTRLSARISLYGSALDTLAQHHPEYLALVWGSLKFVVIGVMNQEELIKELAKALCRIGDVLPQAELHLLLYPTPRMKELVTELYVRIMKFSRRAMKWFTESKAKHILSSIARPYTLRFKDMVEDTSETSRKLERLALSLSMAELRKTRLELQDSRRDQQIAAAEIKQKLDTYHAIHHAGLLDTNRRVCEVQLSQLMSFTSASPFATPEISRRYFAVRRNRNRRKGLDHSSFFNDCPQLQVWESQPDSSQVAIYSGYDTRQAVRDFAVDAIDLIMSAQLPVVWALKLPHTEFKFSGEDVLKYLVSQILRLNEALLNERSAGLNAARYQCATTLEEWFSLLGCVLEGLPQVFLIIDLGLLHSEVDVALAWSRLFEQFFEELKKRCIRTTVKIAFLGTRTRHRDILRDFDHKKILQLPGRKRNGRVIKSSDAHRSKKLKSKRIGRMLGSNGTVGRKLNYGNETEAGKKA